MTKATENNYWISTTAISITLNAMGNRDYIQASVSAGAMIMCFMRDIDGLGYDNGHNYKRWTLLAYPTVFTTQTMKYVYVAIPRPSSAVSEGYTVASDQDHAFLCFPSVEIDLYGCSHTNDGGDEVTTQVGSGAYYYIDLSGRISASTSADREWTADIVTGNLSTDSAIDSGANNPWYEYSTVTEIVTFLKNITFKAGQKFLDFFTNTLKVYQTAEFDGKVTMSDGADIAGAVAIKNGSLSVDGTTTLNGTTHHLGTTNFGEFEKSISGGNITPEGDAELKSLVLRESLTVPKITYNCQEWIGGNTWRSQGGGVIKDVATYNGVHYAILDIKADEGGKVAAGDMCQGIFHLSSGNETEDKDYRNGQFTFKGFKTIYFRIEEVYDSNASDDVKKILESAFPDIAASEEMDIDDYLDMNGIIRFVTRQEAQGKDEDDNWIWGDNTLPQPQMDFAEYANAGESTLATSRQWVTLTTPQYEICLSGMVDWTYGESNIQYIKGYLDGFNITKRKWNSTTRQWEADGTLALEGMGIAFGNAYMWGTLQQFNRAPSLLTQQLYKKAMKTSTAPDRTEIGTSTDQNATESLPYLWAYWKYTYSEGDPTYSDVFLMANYAQSGAKAKLLVLSANSQIIACDKSYVPLVSSDLIITTKTQNITGTVTDNGSWTIKGNGTTDLSSYCTKSGNMLTISATNVATLVKTYKTIVITATLDSLTDTLTVGRTSDGQTGNDAYTVILTNENQTFEADADGKAIATTMSTEVLAYKGTSKIACTIGIDKDTKTLPDGISFNKKEDGTTSTNASITFNILTSLTLGGYIDLPLTIDGKSFTKRMTYSLSKKGATGADGAVIRPCGTWKKDTTYVHNSCFIDVVVSPTDNNYYQVLDGLEFVSEIDPVNDSDHWEAANMLGFVATDLLLSDTIYTKLLQAVNARLDNLWLNKGYGCPKKSDGTLDINNALLKIDGDNGSLTAKNGSFERCKSKGFYSPWVAGDSDGWGSDDRTDYTNDNIYNPDPNGSIGWIGGFSYTPYTLPNGIENAGKMFRLSSCNLTQFEVDSSAELGIDSSDGTTRYFYEDGIMKTRLMLSNEFVELVGLGDGSKLIGYIVLIRANFTTNHRYGAPLNPLAFGTVTGTNSGATIDSKSFDGKHWTYISQSSHIYNGTDAITVERVSTGKYKLTLPPKWFGAASHMFVMTTGVGWCYGSSDNYAIKASVVEQSWSSTSCYVIIATSDDDSLNDGSFNFMIYNQYDWMGRTY